MTKTMDEGIVGGNRITEIATISGVAVAFFKLIEKALPYFISRRNAINVEAGLQGLHATYSEMDGALKDGAQRVMLLCAHNSGGIPVPGQPFYTSAIHWVVKDADKRVPNYKNVEVDADYINMLLQAKKHGRVRYAPDSNTGMLADFYNKEGVTDSVIFFLGITKSRFFYLSLCKYDGKFSCNEITGFSLRANEIKNLLGAYV